MSKLLLHHGSDHIIRKPAYGYGKPYNDYGLGFYCTQDEELAREWAAADPTRNGFMNTYEFDDCGLSILDLSDECILSWIAILTRNRTFEAKGELAQASLAYLHERFLIDTSSYDAIYGWRADDSYFAYASDFINGAISVQKLGRAMKLGNLGMQYMLKSRKAFDRISFIKAEAVSPAIYHERRMERDRNARREYLANGRFSLDKDDLFMIDIIRQEVGRDDPRLW